MTRRFEEGFEIVLEVAAAVNLCCVWELCEKFSGMVTIRFTFEDSPHPLNNPIEMPVPYVMLEARGP
jgi:hypothetical protein